MPDDPAWRLPYPQLPVDTSGSGALSATPTQWNQPTAADAWDWHRQNLADTWQAVQNPQTWVDAAQQYGGAMLMGTETPGSRILAYHGSPYAFDRFDIGKIGTGEGAQVYGHGLYFAEHPDVAQSYRDALATGFQPTLNGVPFAELPEATRSVAQWIRNTGASPSEIADIAEARAAKAIEEGRQLGLGDDVAERYAARHTEQAKAARELAEGGRWDIGSKQSGHMYEVQLKADPEHFLDWDKPLSEQSQHVRDALKGLSISPQEPMGSVLKRAFGNELHGGDIAGTDRATPAEVTQSLANRGIPGIRYLDQGSRASGEGISNYVVFSPEIIDIIRRYGIAGLLGGGAAAGLTPRGDQ